MAGEKMNFDSGAFFVQQFLGDLSLKKSTHSGLIVVGPDLHDDSSEEIAPNLVLVGSFCEAYEKICAQKVGDQWREVSMHLVAGFYRMLGNRPTMQAQELLDESSRLIFSSYGFSVYSGMKPDAVNPRFVDLCLQAIFRVRNAHVYFPDIGIDVEYFSDLIRRAEIFNFQRLMDQTLLVKDSTSVHKSAKI